MSAIAIDVSDTNITLKELVALLIDHQEIIITVNNQPIAKVTAINDQTSETPGNQPKRRRAGTSEGAVWMSPDFNEPLEDFAEYMP